jgi:BlaI family penicillinase repressor
LLMQSLVSREPLPDALYMRRLAPPHHIHVRVWQYNAAIKIPAAAMLLPHAMITRSIARDVPAQPFNRSLLVDQASLDMRRSRVMRPAPAYRPMHLRATPAPSARVTLWLYAMHAAIIPSFPLMRRPPFASYALDSSTYVRTFDSNYRCKSMKISNAEQQVMTVLWRGKALTPDELVAEVGAANGWAAGTVRTLIHRLIRKKAISGTKEKSGYLYRPLISRSDFVQEESKGFLDRLFKGEVAPLVAHLAEHRALTAKDLAKLKRLIAELEDKNG